MKLKKGSKEARDFMAKIRAKKSLGAVKKRQMPKQNKKEIGTRKFQNNTEMVLKGYDHNGNELWVTAKYYDKPKMNERKKNKKSILKGNKHTDIKSHNYKINISGVETKQTYDVYFNNEYDSNNKGFKESLSFCKRYIKMYNNTKESYFADYKNGYVQIINNKTGNVVYSTKVK